MSDKSGAKSTYEVEAITGHRIVRGKVYSFSLLIKCILILGTMIY